MSSLATLGLGLIGADESKAISDGTALSFVVILSASGVFVGVAQRSQVYGPETVNVKKVRHYDHQWPHRRSHRRVSRPAPLVRSRAQPGTPLRAKITQMSDAPVVAL